MKSFLKQAFVLLLFIVLLNSCMLSRLRQDLERQARFSSIAGVVDSKSHQGKPIQVVVIAGEAENFSNQPVVRRAIMSKPGPFMFWLPQGKYVVGAFEDANEDLVFQADEFVGWHGAPDTIDTNKIHEYKKLSIVLRPPRQAIGELPVLYEPKPEKAPTSLEGIRLGDVVSMSDWRFTADNGEMGLWEPVKFLKEIQAGIYFLETYTPRKIPILLVHGAGGNPSNWKHIIAGLDRNRFQPWLLYYPSGLRLDMLRRGIKNGLMSLKLRNSLRRMYVVAHSMGGLVSRGFINLLIEERQAEFIRLFISLSTPWGGHELASKGVKNSPAVVPSWYDMVPHSPYIQRLFNKPFPTHLEYHLIFSHRGGVNMMTGGNTDGTVSLQSQLLLPAQQSAIQIRGYHEDHVSILSSPSVIHQLNLLFENRRKLDG
jgi:uncharacterized alpha/beta hydrolase family protein